MNCRTAAVVVPVPILVKVELRLAVTAATGAATAD